MAPSKSPSPLRHHRHSRQQEERKHHHRHHHQREKQRKDIASRREERGRRDESPRLRTSEERERIAELKKKEEDERKEKELKTILEAQFANSRKTQSATQSISGNFPPSNLSPLPHEKEKIKNIYQSLEKSNQAGEERKAHMKAESESEEMEIEEVNIVPAPPVLKCSTNKEKETSLEKTNNLAQEKIEDNKKIQGDNKPSADGNSKLEEKKERRKRDASRSVEIWIAD